MLNNYNNNISFALSMQLIDDQVLGICYFTNTFYFGLRWEKYDAKGWTEKGAHKYGRLNEQSWWEKWGEHYDGRGSVLKWFSLFVPTLDVFFAKF